MLHTIYNLTFGSTCLFEMMKSKTNNAHLIKVTKKGDKFIPGIRTMNASIVESVAKYRITRSNRFSSLISDNKDSFLS